MRALDPDLQAQLDGGATTLCRCWRIARADGRVLGFTDHDRDLAFDGVVHAAATGLEGSALERGAGLAADDAAVMGALSSEAVTAEDLSAGRYDGAEVSLWLVDWRAPERRHLLFTGTIGRIERTDHAFTAEIEGRSAPLNRPTGRAFLPVCDAEFGDARCGLDASGPEHRVEAVVEAVEGDRTLVCAGLDGFPEGWFTLGAARWASGANAGLAAAVRLHRDRRAALWAPPAAPVAVGDRIVLTAGCDKRLETCRDRFRNLLNFRGFPHVPGDDWVTAYPVEGEAHDGGSRHG